MQNNDISIPDVLNDSTKDLNNVFKVSGTDEDEPILPDSDYYTETEFTDLIITKKISDDQSLSILSINIANLFSKLSNSKIFIDNISTPENKPGIICVVETHISQNEKTGYNLEELTNILPGYKFYYTGRKTKKGGGVGIFVIDRLSEDIETGIGFSGDKHFIDEVFESVSIKIPHLIKNGHNCVGKNLIVIALYRQPGNSNTETFLQKLEKWISTVDKRNNEIVITGDTNLDLL
jgi:exonuclease III